MKTSLYAIYFCLTVAIGACQPAYDDGQSTPQPIAESIDELLLAIAQETGLTPIDISVPFERFIEAPRRLQNVAGALQGGSPNLYVMRYRDDTLINRYHIFAIQPSGNRYIELLSLPGKHTLRVDFTIDGAKYDDLTESLILQTPTGDIRLIPTDVTSVGA